MGGLFERAERIRIEQQVEAQRNFEKKLVQAVLAVGWDPQALLNAVKDPTFGCAWFHENFPKFPCKLEARKVRATIEDLFCRVTTTDAWKMFMRLLEEHGWGTVAMAFEVPGLGTMVMHNWWALPDPPGHTKLVRRAAKEAKGVCVEPLSSFVESIRQAGISL